MKKLIISIALIISLSASAQKDSVRIKDSIQTVKILTEVIQFAEGKNVGIKDFTFLNNVLTAYLKEKQLQWNSKPK